MGKTIVEKILARAGGNADSSAGDIVNAEISHLMTNDAVGELTVDAFEQLGREPWNRQKIAVVLDHYVPATTENAARVHNLLRRFARKHGLRLFDLEGELIKAAEDIGRHNSVDKVVGYALLHNISLHETILACSGRQPEGMVLKAARAGIPIVLTKAAVTDRGIEQAERLGVTLIGFARTDRFTIYAHPERVRVVSSPKTR